MACVAEIHDMNRLACIMLSTHIKPKIACVTSRMVIQILLYIKKKSCTTNILKTTGPNFNDLRFVEFCLSPNSGTTIKTSEKLTKTNYEEDYLFHKLIVRQSQFTGTAS